MRFDKWITGHRIHVNANKVSWYLTPNKGSDRKSFMKFMETVFMYAGTPSLEKELRPKTLADIDIGDVFIQPGSPGHAVIVVDVVTHEINGNKLFLLAQSYMPAQDIHVLKNPSNKGMSPWYAASEIHDEMVTPEWRFAALISGPSRAINDIVP